MNISLRLICRLLACSLLLFATNGQAADEAAARAAFIARPAQQGTIVGIDSQWNVRLQTGDKVQVAPVGDFAYWGSYRDVETGSQIVLVDGSVLRADLLHLTADSLTIGDATGLGRCLWDEAALPRAAIAGIMLQPPADALQRDKLLDRILKHTGAEDELLLAGGESIAGRLHQSPRAGRFHETDESAADETAAEAFRLTPRGADEAIAAPTAKVVAVIFARRGPATQRSASGVQLGLRDGSLLRLQKIAVNSENVELTLSVGGMLTASLAQADEQSPTFWRQITWLQPATPRVVYLSDLPNPSYKHIPLLTLAWPYERDRSVVGGRLRSGGGIYAKGLGMHSASRLAYVLDGSYSRFEAEVALDAAAGLDGSVTVKVIVETAPGKLTTAYESPAIRGGDAPLPLSVDVKGARRLVLLVDFADRGDEQDHLNWLMPRLIK